MIALAKGWRSLRGSPLLVSSALAIIIISEIKHAVAWVSLI